MSRVEVFIDEGRIKRFAADSPSQPNLRCHLRFCGCRRTRFIWISHQLEAIYFDVPKAASSSVRSVLGVLGAHAYLHSTARAIARRMQDEDNIDLAVYKGKSMREWAYLLKMLCYRRPGALNRFTKTIGAALSANDMVERKLHGALRREQDLLDRGEGTVDSPEYGSIYGFRLLDMTPNRAVEEYPQYFKFGFVRNPRDRVASAYCIFCGVDRADRYRKATRALFGKESEAITFDEFVHAIGTVRNCHWEQAVRFFPWTETESLALDFVGRVENIQNDWTQVARRLGLPEELPRLKQTSQSEKPSWTEELKAIVSEQFKEDIEVFGYSL